MGEVYRATDTRLGRDVALKSLPPAFAADPDRLARFEREARLLASLNHPNIAQLYAFEPVAQPDGSCAHVLAMELVEGEDLAQRLKRGPVPFDEAIAIARQIGEALEEAHEKGIVHRDLKPANVKVTPDGRVKVLDFGLAKAWSNDASAVTSGMDLSQSPTLAHTGTAAGLILGTAAYMSPEQARGKSVDKRSDIWAFGVVLFEMLTGKRLFEGETVTDVLASVVKEPIAWEALPATIPANVRRVLQRCLVRDPMQRLRDIGDARLLLREESEPPVATAPARQGGRRTALALVAVALFGALAGGLAARAVSRTPAARVVHVATAVPDLEQGARRSRLALSPDGTKVVLRLADRDGLFLKTLDEFEPRLVAGAEDGFAPFFSPDGEWVGFFVMSSPGGHAASLTTSLRKVRAGGGAPLRVADVASGAITGFSFSGSWGDDGRVVFAGSSRVLESVSASGGTARPVTQLDEKAGERAHSEPHVLPGGRAVLYSAALSGGRSNLMVAPVEGGPGRLLVENASSPRYAGTGHLVFARGQTLFAAPFDAERLALTGEPVPVQDGVDVPVFGDFRTAHFDLSSDGTLAYLRDNRRSRVARLVWVDRQGRTEPLQGAEAGYLHPRLSPDGKRLACAIVDVESGQRDVWVLDLERGSRTRLTFADGTSTDPVWTPDGRSITYGSSRKGGSIDLFSVPADGSSPGIPLTPGRDDESYLFPRAWLPDGSALLAARVRDGHDIVLFRPGAAGAPATFVATPFWDLEPAVSPDGRLLAWASNETGRWEVYLRALREGSRRFQVSADGGDQPQFSVSGRELFYRNGDRMMAVSLPASPDQAPGVPVLLFEGRYESDPFSNDATNYDVARDGRFVMVRRDPDRGRQQLDVIVNWLERLKTPQRDGSDAR
jgi:eukaryotic-like serine/threonine-protein kinase